VTDLFFKFPSTPHLAVLGDNDIRGDKILLPAEQAQCLRHKLVIEEKVDGANLGISFDSDGNIHAQNRGAYLTLPGSGQWQRLGEWLEPRMDAFFEHLTDRYILFGEWCYARHSVSYDRLPDWFLGFDIYDKKEGRFLSVDRRDAFLSRLGITRVPVIAEGHFSLQELEKLFTQSRFSDQPMEGLYLRFDKDGWLEQRAKLIRPAFIQAITEHWSRLAIQPNRLDVRVN